MRSKKFLVLLSALLMVMAVGLPAAYGVGDQTPECSDGRDNGDPEDSYVDKRDPGCHTDGNPTNFASYDPNDNDEDNKTECSDDKDNADLEDELADAADPGCHTDGDPNDGDETYDFRDTDEQNRPQCSDGRDNSDPEDLLADAKDPGCHTDADPANPESYDPKDNDEAD